jgi:hypothetical protein
MRVQTSSPNEQPSLHLQVEAGRANCSEDVGSYNGTWHLRIGFGLACLALMGVSAWAVLPHASLSDSARLSGLDPVVAFSPDMLFLKTQTPALSPRGSAIVMAVPKKRQSKMKTRQRKANWFAKSRRQATLAWSRAMSLKYDPFQDPKYSSNAPDDDEDEEDDDE